MIGGVALVGIKPYLGYLDCGENAETGQLVATDELHPENMNIASATRHVRN